MVNSRLYATLVLLIQLMSPSVSLSQEPPSSFADPEARRLVEGSIFHQEVLLRKGAVRGIVRSRFRTGILIPSQWNWRHRTLFHKETLGVAEYTVNGGREEAVLAQARGAPVIGDALIDRAPLWGYLGFDPERSEPALLGLLGLSLVSIAPDVPSGGAPGLYDVFDSEFVDPLGPRGPATYSYNTGRDIELDGERPQTLRGVEFRPTDPDANALTGIVWFDVETGRPVRSMIRPEGRTQLSGGLRGMIRKLPLLQKDAQGDLDFLTVSYVQREDGLSWPKEAHLHGNMYLFWNQAVLPVQLEWELDWDEDPPPVSEAQPPEPLQGGWGFSLEHRALNPFIRDLDRVVGPPPAPSFKQVALHSLSAVRFNQVQGVNFRVLYSAPLGARTVLHSDLGIPTSSFRVTGGVDLEMDSYPFKWGIGGYSRLKDANWMEQTNGFTSSLTALLTGYDDGQYYLASGGELWMEYGDRPWSGSLGLFAEHHEEAPKVATYSLFKPDSMEAPPPDLEIDQGNYYGVRTRLDLQAGDDPQRAVLIARLYGQAAVGERSFVAVGTTTDLVGPLPGPFTGAFRVQAGLASDDSPGQALFYLGGYKTLRGYPANIASGSSTLILTAEVGTEVPLVRLIAFGDLGWANDAGHLFHEDALTAVGAGVSIADGILRLDLAKGLSAGGVWRLQLATSGLF